MNFHSPHRRADQTFNDHRILIAFVLYKNCIARVVNRLRDPFPAVAGAPDQMRVFAGVEVLALPIRLEALDDFLYLMLVRGDDGVVSGTVRFFVSQFSDFTKALLSSTTIDFSWVMPNLGLLSITSTPAAFSIFREC